MERVPSAGTIVPFGNPWRVILQDIRNIHLRETLISKNEEIVVLGANGAEVPISEPLLRFLRVDPRIAVTFLNSAYFVSRA